MIYWGSVTRILLLGKLCKNLVLAIFSAPTLLENRPKALKRSTCPIRSALSFRGKKSEISTLQSFFSFFTLYRLFIERQMGIEGYSVYSCNVCPIVKKMPIDSMLLCCSHYRKSMHYAVCSHFTLGQKFYPKIHILSNNSQIENPNFYKIHLSEISFSQNSHCQSPFFTKFTFPKSHFSQNSHFSNIKFLVISG